MNIRLTSQGAGAIAVAADPDRASSLSFFRYASACKLAKHQCRFCGTPIRRRGVRRVVLCPVCNAALDLK